jgi:hypothetical protein
MGGLQNGKTVRPQIRHRSLATVPSVPPSPKPVSPERSAAQGFAKACALGRRCKAVGRWEEYVVLQVLWAEQNTRFLVQATLPIQSVNMFWLLMPIIHPNYPHGERQPPLKWQIPRGRPFHLLGFEFVKSRIGFGLRATRFFEKDDEIVGFNQPYRLNKDEKARDEALREQVYNHIEQHGDDGVEEWRRISSKFKLDNTLKLRHWDMVVHNGLSYYTDMAFMLRIGTPAVPGPAWYYLNHSHNANLTMVSVGPLGKKTINFKAKRRIQAGEILTFDYKATEGEGWLDPQRLLWTQVKRTRSPLRKIVPRRRLKRRDDSDFEDEMSIKEIQRRRELQPSP